MDIKGKWRCSHVQIKNQSGEPEWVGREEFAALLNEDAEFSIFNATLMFCDDGLMRTLFDVKGDISSYPPEQIYDGMLMPNEAVEWKIEDGKLLTAISDDGEWTELPVIDGRIELAVFRFERV